MDISPFYEKKIECLHCKLKFNTLKVRSKSVKVSGSDTDFMPIYGENDINALYYNVFVCEHCGFSFTDDFSSYLAPHTKEAIYNKLSSKWVPHKFDGERDVYSALQTYKLALYCAEIKDEKTIIIAGLLLRITWLYRSLGNTSQEMRFMKLALARYQESYSKEDYVDTQMSDMRVLYMIGELARRLEDYQTATRFFSKIFEYKADQSEAKLLEMAKDQWELVREARQALRG